MALDANLLAMLAEIQKEVASEDDSRNNGADPPSPPIAPPPSGGHDGDMDPPDKERLKVLETKWDAVIPTLATKTDIAALSGDMHKMDASIKTWMVATIIGLFLGFSGLIFTASGLLRPSAPAAAPLSPQAAAPPAPAASR